jgi:hypothetical protein
LKAFLLGVYGFAIEPVVSAFIDKFPFTDSNGVLVKYGILDTLEDCVSGIGQGNQGQRNPGSCPFSTGGKQGNGTWTIGGKAPDGNPVENVYH